jgi:hypothetical protein
MPLLDRLVTLGRVDGPLVATALGDDEWRELVDAAAHDRVLALLAAAVDTRRLPTTDGQRRDVARITTGLSLAALAQEQAVAVIGDALGGIGVQSRILKGHAVAGLAYPDSRWRQSGDVDIAVPAGEFAAAGAALTRLGATSVTSYELGPTFSRLEKAATFRLPDGVEIDLHRRIQGEVGRYAITERDLFASPRTVSVGAAHALAPSVEATLVHAAIHLSSVRTRRSTMADLVRLVRLPDLDIDRALAIAARGGSLPVLVWALGRADEVWALPPVLRDRLDAIHFRRRDRLAANLVLDRPSCRVLVQVADEPPARWPGLAREVLWPSRQFLDAAHRSRLDHLRHVATASSPLAKNGARHHGA